MKKEEVPQDDADMLQGKFKKLMYATDGSEHYTEIGSVGWEAENVVLQQAWEEIDQKIEDARMQVLHGEASILLYHMEKNLMDPYILAGYVDTFPFMVKLHMKPFFFKRLSKSTLNKYAYAFRMSVKDMIDIEKIKKPNI
jgi:hypothetical protein